MALVAVCETHEDEWNLKYILIQMVLSVSLSKLQDI